MSFYQQSDGTWKRFFDNWCGNAPRDSFYEEQSVEDTDIPIPPINKPYPHIVKQPQRPTNKQLKRLKNLLTAQHNYQLARHQEAPDPQTTSTPLPTTTV